MNDRLRFHWSILQGLDGSLAGASAHDVLARAGWMRTVGGAGPYLGLHARAGLSRAAVDAAVAAGDICELPSARGCTYLVPRADYALALRLGQGKSEATEISNAKKLGATDAELDRLHTKILDSLGAGPLEPKELKEACGDAVRSFGDEGKKKGMTTTLPVGLGWLQSRGLIRRIPVNGRLDAQRFAYARWSPSPLDGVTLADDEVAYEITRRFFDWIGVSSLDQLAWWTGLTKRACKQALSDLGVEPLVIEGDQLAAETARLAFERAPVPSEPNIRLVGSLDNLFHLRREIAPHVHPDDAAQPVAGGGFTTVQRGEQVSSVLDLPHHAVVDRGRIVGVWDYDADRGEVVARAFQPSDGFTAAVARTERFVREELGDARAFSLDTMTAKGRGNRAERLAVLRG